MRSWRVIVFALGIAIALVGLGTAIYLNQSTIAVVAVLAAVFTALSPTIVPSLSDEIQGNNDRYGRHRAYFADVILPNAGSMSLVDPHQIRELPSGRIGWRMQEDAEEPGIGRGEDRIPAYNEVYLPHLMAGTPDKVWVSLREEWDRAKIGVTAYTDARQSFDKQFYEQLSRLVAASLGPEYQFAWTDSRSTQIADGARVFHAAQVRDVSEYWWDGRYGKPGWDWIGARLASPQDIGGVPWNILIGNGMNGLLWGGKPVPGNLEELRGKADQIVDDLKSDDQLKQLYLSSKSLRERAAQELAPLSDAAEDAVHLLQHGPDIPGECVYCRAWHPRF